MTTKNLLKVFVLYPSGDAEAVEAAKFGTKYVVRGVLAGPDGRSAAIVTVWIILSGTTTPRFVTAYPED